jgi:hypothetical protein
MNEYILPKHVIRKTSSTVKALAAKKLDDIMTTAATPSAEPPIVEPKAPKAKPKAEPPIVEPEAPKAKRGRKAGPKADTIETPPADDAGINTEEKTDENGADE